ncbi:GNAT family N-acetyltransferase [Spirochaeta isovalerica]|uniref:GNAT superfamily N-acetyltransferase n=1 Tax=Spirochaeta isovalerica TaxID=150 RepID=A0A841RA96_9SPIO|nr:GNAT family N-acetyltransferase [Spirochaeta isovalerica]MBB6480167.1 GNAT superfamily N-acetyltransferase [Spirochaeta isovalerica]
MNLIKVISRFDDISDPDALIFLMSQQMATYGADPDKERLRKGLINALKESSRAVLFLKSDTGGKPEAFAFANICSGLESGGDYLWINELYVDELLRNRGVATEILNFIDSWCRENDLVYIACSSGLKNDAALSLYRKNGFVTSETIWVDKEL